jgi:leucyl-tRNA synthetase
MDGMAVPGEDQRDWDFATAFGIPIVETVTRPEGWEGEAGPKRTRERERGGQSPPKKPSRQPASSQSASQRASQPARLAAS